MLTALFVRTIFQAVFTMLALLLMLQPVNADLISFGSQWQYLDTGSAQQSGWQYPDFDDNTWSSGSGQLGYGDGDEATVVSFGADPRNKHITTYFRHQFDVASLPSGPLSLRVQRDDGVVVYLNGAEVFRDNMPDGVITSDTLASSSVGGSAESALQSTFVNPGSFVLGSNILAVEIHQVARGSSDISFDLQLADSPVIRGPYLQQASATGITVRWRTETDRDAVLRYGTDPSNLDQFAGDPTASTEHAITLTGLIPDTRYYYGLGDSAGDYMADDDQYFDTHPAVGSAASTRIWVLGDSGTADARAAAVRDSYIEYNGGTHSDVLLMLGDNAYDTGTDAEYQAAVFDMYPHALRNSVLWPTLGNHDAHTADSGTQSGPYYDIFTLPAQGESGGIPSGTEAYYSFDYGNIHFVSLDSHDTNRSANGAMATWLENDLAANTQEWIIAYWHHPPYSKGSHDSDSPGRHTDMRSNFLPILESHGVDLVLSGHSHSYERSMLINGHYGTSDTFNDTYVLDHGDGDPVGDGRYNKSDGSNNGSIYTVAGSSGQLGRNAPLDHPVMISNLIELGSMIIDVQGNQLDAIFLNSESRVRDSFRIVHSSEMVPPVAPAGLSATLSSDSDVNLQWTDNASNASNIVIQRSRDQLSWSDVATLNANASSFTDSGLSPDTTYYYRIIANNAAGESSTSETASVTTPTQNTTVERVDIGSAILDHDKVDGNRWTRVNFDPLISGTHTIRVTWNGNADIQFTLFQVRSGGSDQRIAMINNDSPAEWTGMLDSSQQYYLGVWSAFGSASFAATLEAEVPNPASVVTIDQGTLDADHNEGPRWVRLDFEPLTEGLHSISVAWNNSDADVRYRVNRADGTNVSPTIRGVNPGVWEGVLEVNTAYYIGLWSTDGIADYTATIEADLDF